MYFFLKAILIGMGLQYKSIEELEKELQLPPNQLLAMFNKIVKKYISMIESKNLSAMGKEMFGDEEIERKKKENGRASLMPLEESLEEELEEAAQKVKERELDEKKKLLGIDFKQYEIKGSEKEWTDALKLPVKSSYVSVKRFGKSFFWAMFVVFIFLLKCFFRMTEKRKVDVESHFDASAAKTSGENWNENGDSFKRNKKSDKKNKKFKH